MNQRGGRRLEKRKRCQNGPSHFHGKKLAPYLKRCPRSKGERNGLSAQKRFISSRGIVMELSSEPFEKRKRARMFGLIMPEVF